MGEGSRAPASPGARVIGRWADEVERGRGGCLVVEERAHVAELDAITRSVRTIRVRAAPDEQLLAYAALAELTRPLLGLLGHLPDVQAAALSGALALAPATGDELAVASGFRSLLHVAAERSPLVVRIDDAHLLDRGTAGVIAYAARRLDAAAAGIVVVQDPSHPERLALPDAVRLGPHAPDASVRAAITRADAVAALDRAQLRGSAGDLAAAWEAAAAAGAGAHARVAAGRAWLDAGRLDRALVAAGAALDDGPDDAVAARAELLLGRIEAVRGSGRQSARHFRAAADLAERDAPVVAAAALLQLVPPALNGGRHAHVQQLLGRALEHLERAGSDPEADELRRFAAAAQTASALASGTSRDVGPILELAAVAELDVEPAGDLSLLVTMVALPLVWQERMDEARGLLRSLVASLRRRGAIGALPLPLCALAVAERRSGRLSRALILAAEARDLAEQTGNRAAALFAYAELANVHSLFADVDQTRAAADKLLGAGGPRRGVLRLSALSALGTVELLAGNPQGVIELLEPLVTEAGISPMVALFQSTLIGAYVAAGRIDDAAPLLDALEAAAPPTDGRLQAALARGRALVAPAGERDRRFAEAAERAGGNEVVRGLTQLHHARRLLTDGERARGVALLQELAEHTDENRLGAARAARCTLVQLGVPAAGGDPAWVGLSPAELEVAFESAARVPVLTVADRLHLSPPEVERIRDDLALTVGARSGRAVTEGLRRHPSMRGDARPRFEVQLLGGLAVVADGAACALPTGAAATTVAVLALRRAVHVEELTDILWPEVEPDVGRRRLRNVLARVRRACGDLLVRCGERIELAAEAVVDHHLLESRARSTLSATTGPERLAALEALAAADQDQFLPEARYEAWSEAAQHRTTARRVEVLRALAEAREAAGDHAGAVTALDDAAELVDA